MRVLSIPGMLCRVQGAGGRQLPARSIFEALGPLLSATVAIFNDASRFAGVIAVVTVGYANAFYSLVTRRAQNPP